MGASNPPALLVAARVAERSRTHSITFHRQITPDAPVFNLFQPNSRAQPNSQPDAPSKGAAQMIKMSWSQSNRRVFGGALPSGNIANSAEGSLPFKCARILSISPVVRHSLFNAGNDLDLLKCQV